MMPGWISRGFRAVVTERRVPWRVQQTWNRVAAACGLRLHTVTAEGLRFRVRRQTLDELIVRNVVERQEYTAVPGFAIHAGDTVVDIGGNIGAFAVSAAR